MQLPLQKWLTLFIDLCWRKQEKKSLDCSCVRWFSLLFDRNNLFKILLGYNVCCISHRYPPSLTESIKIRSFIWCHFHHFTARFRSVVHLGEWFWKTPISDCVMEGEIDSMGNFLWSLGKKLQVFLKAVTFSFERISSGKSVSNKGFDLTNYPKSCWTW